ncbi:MAG: hypothetical protein GW855_08910 [Erythrobacter sp.]|nr:hypothetical protein [Erythrobacter sp.]NCQ63346.1 hypothetical protein [Alphaproteobacteria bacterium]
MSDFTTRITAAIAAVIIATTSMAAIVTVPPAANAPAVATVASPELA